MSNIGRLKRIVGPRVLVRMDAPETMSPAGLLHIPDAAQEQVAVGTVVAVGTDETDPDTGHTIPLGIEVGQRAVMGKYNGVRVDEQLGIQDGHEYRMCLCNYHGHDGHGIQDIYAVMDDD